MKLRLLFGFLLLTALGTASGNAQPYYDPDILSLINQHGCTDCHGTGGSGGLSVTPYSSIMTTGIHGPVVVPFDSNSVIVRKLKGTAGFGSRMPQGGPFLPDAEIQTFVQWIMNGALETATTSISPDDGMPRAFALSQNYPNPFNPTTNIRFQVPEATHVTLSVYDRLGREVGVLVDGQMDAGTYEVQFSASGGAGAEGSVAALASGLYLYRLQAGTFVETKKMIVVK